MYGNFKSHLTNQLNQIYDDGLYKTEREITTPQGSIVNTIEVNNLINLCANNYLGLAENPSYQRCSKKRFR
jgi:glycine C-acetyltransferase